MNVKVQDPTFELALVSPFLLQTLAEVVQNEGIDPESLCRGLGFSLEDLQDPAQRISYRQAVVMIQRALKLLPDRGLGLWVGHRNVLGTLGLLGIGVVLLAFKITAKGRFEYTPAERARVELSRYRCFLLGLPEELVPAIVEAKKHRDGGLCVLF